MATLGELLFYVATQQQDVQSGTTAQEVSDCWSINSSTISAVTRWGAPAVQPQGHAPLRQSSCRAMRH